MLTCSKVYSLNTHTHTHTHRRQTEDRHAHRHDENITSTAYAGGKYCKYRVENIKPAVRLS